MRVSRTSGLSLLQVDDFRIRNLTVNLQNMKLICWLVAFILLSACNTVRVTPLGDFALPAVRRSGGHPKVYLSESEVNRNHVRLAELRMSVSGLELAEIASKFQLKAAQIGADGVLLVEVDSEAEGQERFMDGGSATAIALGFR